MELNFNVCFSRGVKASTNRDAGKMTKSKAASSSSSSSSESEQEKKKR